MNMQEVKKMAQGMGLKTHSMKKTEVIRAIQRAENNFDCYGTQRLESCQENECLWKKDCIKANKGNIFNLASLKNLIKKDRQKIN